MSNANPRSTQDSECAIRIFAKAPVPGRCKTRLTRGCTPIRAARIYRALLEHTVAAVCACSDARPALTCTPSIRDPWFQRLARAYPIDLVRQARGTLGQRMHAAFRSAWTHYRAVLVIGSDQPLLADACFDAAVTALSQPDAAWLAPTVDGGYWAIGLTRPEARVFHGPAWSTARVAGQTRRALARVGLKPLEWPARNDIDTWRDWIQLDAETRRGIARDAAMPGRAAFRRAAAAAESD